MARDENAPAGTGAREENDQAELTPARVRSDQLDDWVRLGDAIPAVLAVVLDMCRERRQEVAGGPRFDVGQSEQVCPRCSTVEHEVMGVFDRDEARFRCDHCGVILSATRYETALEDYRAARWRALGDLRRVRELVRRHR